MKKMKTLLIAFVLLGGMTTMTYAQTTVDDAELEEFANVFQKLMIRNQEFQQELIGLIEDEGSTVQQYQEMSQAEMNMEEDKFSEAEWKTKKTIDAKIGEIQPKIEEEQKSLIESSDMGIDRYNEVAAAIQSDQELQQKVQKILMEKSQQN